VSANADQTGNTFTIMNPAMGTVNQQCFLTVFPSGAAPDPSHQYPTPYFTEGNYVIKLSGGGGGSSNDDGVGGAGAGSTIYWRSSAHS